jgi:hypothetical protein
MYPDFFYYFLTFLVAVSEKGLSLHHTNQPANQPAYTLTELGNLVHTNSYEQLFLASFTNQTTKAQTS